METNIRLLNIFHSVVDACSHFEMHSNAFKYNVQNSFGFPLFFFSKSKFR